MSIDLARQIAGALDIRSEDKIRILNQALTAYVRLTRQSPATQIPGAIDASQVTSGEFDDARIAESSVTQHEAALDIDWPQLTSVPSEFTPEDHLTAGSWTPTDQSGGSLSFASAAGLYRRHEDLMFAWFQLQWPATADTNANDIGGLPGTVLNSQAARTGMISYNNTGLSLLCFPTTNSTQFRFVDLAGAFPQNDALSGKYLYGLMIYPVEP